MHLSDLQSKDIITTDGKLVGNIVDVVIMDGRIDYLIVERNNSFISRFRIGEEMKVSWSQIKKIGDDVILVAMD